MSNKTTALIIGRFQPFHLGHLMLIEEAAGNSDAVVIGIGSSQKSHTPENPFTAGERKRMIEQSLEQSLAGSLKIKSPGEFHIVNISDIGNNELWVSHVEKLTPEFDVVYTNGELERRLFKEAGYQVHATGFFNRDSYSGVEIRKRIKSGGKWEDLVPGGTLQVMGEIDGVERIRKPRKC